MASVKPCGCKGIRTCLLCEEEESIQNYIEQDSEVFTFCSKCELCWPNCPSVDNPPVYLGKFKLYEEFLSIEEEERIVCAIDEIPWMLSQSGRKKQDFGPKVNFKKKKGKVGDFRGFPYFSRLIVDRMQLLPELVDFQPIELCNLEYSPERGSAIDPHIDDSWIWGERLVTVNLVSNTVLTLTPANSKFCKCDLELKHHYLYEDILNSKMDTISINTSENFPTNPNKITFCEYMKTHMLGSNDSIISSKFQIQAMCNNFRCTEKKTTPSICINLPPRSLLVLAGCARHNWYHEIKRQDIKSRRLAMTFRELANDFITNDVESKFAKELLNISKIFCNFS
ncbi:alpha-ketoglutarate-dependent dioxygenase alkB homolog 4-like isoform X2 [Uloborus diversus]|nr:alpha-ketoglutarate-dependent dioxygenase alkB homolog 4-like isoform X2 [Uloborus diversus]